MAPEVVLTIGTRTRPLPDSEAALDELAALLCDAETEPVVSSPEAPDSGATPGRYKVIFGEVVVIYVVMKAIDNLTDKALDRVFVKVVDVATKWAKDRVQKRVDDGATHPRSTTVEVRTKDAPVIGPTVQARKSSDGETVEVIVSPARPLSESPDGPDA